MDLNVATFVINVTNTTPVASPGTGTIHFNNTVNNTTLNDTLFGSDADQAPLNYYGIAWLRAIFPN